MGWNDPNWLDFSDRSQRGRNEHREIAALRRGWLRPGRFFEPQNSAHSSLLSCRRQRGVQRAPSSCSPPHGWRRTARPKEPQKLGPFVFDRSRRRTNIKAEAASKRRCASPPHPGAAGRPLTWRLRYSLSTQSKDQSTITSTAQFTAPAKPQTRPGTAGKPVTVFPPEERAQPKAQPNSPSRVGLTAAPLALRRIFARLARFILFRLTAEIVESLL